MSTKDEPISLDGNHAEINIEVNEASIDDSSPVDGNNTAINIRVNESSPHEADSSDGSNAEINIEVNEAANSDSRWSKFRATAMSVVGLMIAFGSWNDTKELSLTIYNGIITHFTHQAEAAQLTKLDVGNYLEFTEAQFGIPQVIKQSKLRSELQYRYYKTNKYLLTLQVQEERISGYIVNTLPLNDNFNTAGPFTPAVPFNQIELNQEKLAILPFTDDGFSLDNHNLVYYLERHALGPQGLYLNLYLGMAEYNQTLPQLRERLGVLDRALALSQGDDHSEAITDVRSHYAPNFYGLSELDIQYMAESLLTQYEFNAYF